MSAREPVARTGSRAARCGLVLVIALASLRGQEGAHPSTSVNLIQTRIDTTAKVEHSLLVDLDGDLRDDILLLTADQRMAVCFQSDDGHFVKAGDIEVPAKASAWAIADLLPTRGAELVWLDADGVAVVPLEPEALGPSRPYAEIPLAFPERRLGPLRFWAWGGDVDGDGHQDLLVPGLSEDLLLRGGPGAAPQTPHRAVPVPNLVTVSRALSGTVALTRRRPRTVFHRLLDPAELSPAYLDSEGLRALGADRQGAFTGESQLVFAFSREGRGALGLLQRTELSLRDLDADGLEDLVLSRTGSREGAATEIRTDLLFFRNGERPVSRPSFVLLLPGVLSSGPDLVDLDGDGRLDLWLSVFGGSLRSEVARRVFRRVGLDYHVYLGRSGSPPFGRSPDASFEDQLEVASFETWDLRHRIQLQGDWNGDRRHDLVRLCPLSDDRIEVRLHLASAPATPYAIDEDALAASIEVKGPITGYAAREVRGLGPAVQITHERGVTLVYRDR
jgi:hypothetical protein